MSLGPTENQTNAQFHWGEGNKFALELCKSLVILNSTMAISIAFAENKSEIIANPALLKYSIFWLLLATLCSILLMPIAYLINLRHGNSHIDRKINEHKSDQMWKSASKFQLMIYILILAIFIFIFLAFKNIFSALGISFCFSLL